MSGGWDSEDRRKLVRWETYVMGIMTVITPAAIIWVGSNMVEIKTEVAAIKVSLSDFSEDVKEVKKEVSIVKSRQDERTSIIDSVKRCITKFKCYE